MQSVYGVMTGVKYLHKLAHFIYSKYGRSHLSKAYVVQLKDSIRTPAGVFRGRGVRSTDFEPQDHVTTCGREHFFSITRNRRGTGIVRLKGWLGWIFTGSGQPKNFPDIFSRFLDNFRLEYCFHLPVISGVFLQDTMTFPHLSCWILRDLLAAIFHLGSDVI